MRSRRVVLCVDADEGALSRRAFLLETRRRFAVLQASSGLAALELLRQLPSGRVVVLVAEYDLGLDRMNGEELVAQVRAIDPAVRSVVTSRTGACWPSFADLLLGNSTTQGNAELVERVTVLAARKPGPRREPALGVGAQRAAALAIRGVA